MTQRCLRWLQCSTVIRMQSRTCSRYYLLWRRLRKDWVHSRNLTCLRLGNKLQLRRYCYLPPLWSLTIPKEPVLLYWLQLSTIIASTLHMHCRSYGTPPSMVMHVMSSVCVLLQQPTDWNTVKHLMADPMAFLKTLTEFDKDNVSDKVAK